MSQRQTIAMQMRSRGERAERAREELAGALPSADVGEPDETGAFEVGLDASSFEAALDEVFNAVAASGTDDHLVFMEHPDVPEHWRHRAEAPPQP